MSEATTAKKMGSDGFWSNVKGGFGEGLSRVGKELLPVWAAKELKQQTTDQLASPTANLSKNKPRINDGLETTTQSATKPVMGLPFNALQITMIAGAFLFGIILLGVMVRR